MTLGAWFLLGQAAISGDDAPSIPGRKAQKKVKDPRSRPDEDKGTPGYGPPGLYPGYYGFGLGYPRGYGYGGDALGTGAGGGYPFYGGPGYPHPAPCLRRFGPITPFAYFGGPGYPSPGHANYYGGIGGLAPDRPAITFEDDFGGSDYGVFTGAIPYPESAFAPDSSATPGYGPTAGASRLPPDTPTNPASAIRRTVDVTVEGRSLGIVTESDLVDGPARGLKITRIDPSGPAEKAGLHAGDVIRSANGYLTEVPGNLTWIMANASPGGILKMRVHTSSDHEAPALTAARP